MLMALSGKAALKLHYYLVIVESLENLCKCAVETTAGQTVFKKYSELIHRSASVLKFAQVYFLLMFFKA